MTRTELIEYFEKTTKRMCETCKAKNADYAGTEEDQDCFANFTKVELLGFATAEQGFLTRMTDKFCRIGTFVKKGVLQVKDETVEDTFIDLANYCLLMAAYVKSKRSATSGKVSTRQRNGKVGSAIGSGHAAKGGRA